jgi:hypothetical protein
MESLREYADEKSWEQHIKPPPTRFNRVVRQSQEDTQVTLFECSAQQLHRKSWSYLPDVATSSLCMSKKLLLSKLPFKKCKQLGIKARLITGSSNGTSHNDVAGRISHYPQLSLITPHKTSTTEPSKHCLEAASVLNDQRLVTQFRRQVTAPRSQRKQKPEVCTSGATQTCWPTASLLPSLRQSTLEIS